MSGPQHDRDHDGHGRLGRAFAIGTALKRRFGIDHATIQIETNPAHPCALEKDEVI